jgi:hypothetical protein
MAVQPSPVYLMVDSSRNKSAMIAPPLGMANGQPFGACPATIQAALGPGG